MTTRPFPALQDSLQRPGRRCRRLLREADLSLSLSLCVISLGDEPSATPGSCEPLDEVVTGRVLYTQAVRIATNRAKEAGGGYGVREFFNALGARIRLLRGGT